MLVENQEKIVRLEKASSKKDDTIKQVTEEIESIKGNALKKFETIEKNISKI